MAEVRPEDVPNELVNVAARAWLAAAQNDDLRGHEMSHALAAAWTDIEAMVREKVAQDLLAVDPIEWALAGQHCGLDAARIARGEAGR